MSKIAVSSSSSFLVQIYFVLASLLGLMLVVMGSVNVVQLGLKEILGVKEYPYFSAPYPAVEKFPGETAIDETELTDEQRQKWAEWETEYDAWKQAEKEFNRQDQQTRRDLVTALAMLIVGIPVFAIHAPYVFRRR